MTKWIRKKLIYIWKTPTFFPTIHHKFFSINTSILDMNNFHNTLAIPLQTFKQYDIFTIHYSNLITPADSSVSISWHEPLQSNRTASSRSWMTTWKVGNKQELFICRILSHFKVWNTCYTFRNFLFKFQYVYINMNRLILYKGCIVHCIFFCWWQVYMYALSHLVSIWK